MPRGRKQAAVRPRNADGLFAVRAPVVAPVAASVVTPTVAPAVAHAVAHAVAPAVAPAPSSPTPPPPTRRSVLWSETSPATSSPAHSSPPGSSPPPSRLRDAGLRKMCMRCTHANTEAAVKAVVVDSVECVRAKAHHTRCIRCAKGGKECINWAEDLESRRRARVNQDACDAVFNAVAALKGDGQVAPALIKEAKDSLASLQHYVFRDGQAVVPGGRSGKRRRVATTASEQDAVMGELRLLRQDLNSGFAMLGRALRSMDEDE